MATNSTFTLFNKGSIGDITAYTDRNGRTVFRMRYNKAGKGIRTVEQQLVRARWHDVLNAYGQMKPFLTDSFTVKEPKQSNFNAFMANNMPISTAYLTREEAQKGGCVLEDFVISTGRLASISLEEKSGMLVSNIRLHGLSAIDDTTTIGQLSAAIIGDPTAVVGDVVYNPNKIREMYNLFVEGDELYFYRVVQLVDEVPHITVVRNALQLTVGSTKLLKNQVSFDGFKVVHTTINGVEGDYLACESILNTGASYLHSRVNQRGELEVSGQKLVSNNSWLEPYASRSAQVKAINSYGGVNRTSFLRPTPNDDAYLEFEENGGEPITPAPPYSGPTGDDTPSTTQVVITAVASPSSAGTVTGGGTYAKGTQVTLKATANNASLAPFAKWSDGVTQNPRTITANASATFTAIFGSQSGGGDEAGGNQPGGGID